MCSCIFCQVFLSSLLSKSSNVCSPSRSVAKVLNVAVQSVRLNAGPKNVLISGKLPNPWVIRHVLLSQSSLIWNVSSMPSRGGCLFLP